MSDDWYEVSESFASSSVARRIGFKPQRWCRIREESIASRRPPAAIAHTLSSVLQSGFVTAVLEDGMPCVVGRDESVYIFDEATETFFRSHIEYETVYGTNWACVAPCFPGIVAELSDPTVTSLTTFSRGDNSFEAITHKNISEFRIVAQINECLGYVESAPYFNKTLSRAISLSVLRSRQSFAEIFPEKEIAHSEPDEVEETEVGRIIISYRHQAYGKDRITFDDWICSCPAIERVMNAYGWQKARFWTDARLRSCQKSLAIDTDVSWAEVGVMPYKLGPVVVLNHSKQPSVIDRFWLTVERKTGAHHYGTWLTDDCGDSFYYLLESHSELYSRAIVTSVSTSQGITWASDRTDILKHEWRTLDVSDVELAVELLREPLTFQAREDYVDEDIDVIEIGTKGTTLGWCGDVEALIDPPSLAEIFGSVGSISHELPLQVIETDRSVKETTVTVVVFRTAIGRKKAYIEKRLYVDCEGEIRARSVPRLVDSDYAQNILKFPQAREVDLKDQRPAWLVGNATPIPYGRNMKLQCCNVS